MMIFWAPCQIRTDDFHFTRVALWPTELRGRTLLELGAAPLPLSSFFVALWTVAPSKANTVLMAWVSLFFH